MTEQRRKVEKEMKDAERLFERAKRDWQVTWRDDDRHTRDAERLAEQNNRKRERDQRDADRDLAQLEKVIERREKETAQRYAHQRDLLARRFASCFQPFSGLPLLSLEFSSNVY